MKTKSKRLLSLALAVVMAVSASMACFSAYAYKPSYGEKATERQFTAMIGDLTQLLDDNLITGDVIESLYEALPSLSAVLSKADGSTSAEGNYYITGATGTVSDEGGEGDSEGDEEEEEVVVYESATITANVDGIFNYMTAGWNYTTSDYRFTVTADSSKEVTVYAIYPGYSLTNVYINGVAVTDYTETTYTNWNQECEAWTFTIDGADYANADGYFESQYIYITADIEIPTELTINIESENVPGNSFFTTFPVTINDSTFETGDTPYIQIQGYEFDSSWNIVTVDLSDYYVTITLQYGNVTRTLVSNLVLEQGSSYDYGAGYQIYLDTTYLEAALGLYKNATVTVTFTEAASAASLATLSATTLDATDEDVVEEDVVEEDAVEEDVVEEDAAEDVTEDTDAELDVVSFFADNDFLSYCNEDGTIADDTFENFFADHPITVESETEFAEWLKQTIENYIIVNGITSIIQVAAPGTEEEVETSELVALFESVDMICEALGIEQEVSLADAFGIKYIANGHNQSYDEINAYIANIIDAIFADDDAVNNIIDILQVALTDDNFSLLYDGIVGVLDNIDAVLGSLSSLISDLDSVLSTVNQISSILKDIPKVEGNDSLIDINALIPYILTMDSIAETIGNYVTVNEDGSIHVNAYSIVDLTLTLPEIDLTHITEAESNADVLKAVVDYVYKVFNTNYDQLNEFLGTYGNVLTNVLTSDLVGLSADVADLLVSFLTTFVYGTNDDAAWWVITLVAGFTERDVNAIDEDLEPDSGSGSTDSGSGSTSGTSTGTTASGTSTGTSDSADDDTTTSTVTSTSIPDTGRVDEGVATAALIVFVCAAAALVVVLAKTRKKVSE